MATRRAPRARGAVAVEFGIIFPILIMLVFGIVDFGYMLNRDTMVNNASRDGARVASLDGSYSEVLAAVKSELSGYGLPTTGPNTTITIDCKIPPVAPSTTYTACNATSATYDTKAVSGTTAVVTVSYKHKWLTPLVSGLFGTSMTLVKTTEMRVE